jgi:phosphatidylserine synthase
MVDGSVARALARGEPLRRRVRTAADFVTQAVAPALIVYLAYRDAPAASGCRPAARRRTASCSPP